MRIDGISRCDFSWPLWTSYSADTVENFFFFFAGRPNLFAICNNTFSKWWEESRMSCRRVLSSTPLLARGSKTV
jgi:hypothetical protein